MPHLLRLLAFLAAFFTVIGVGVANAASPVGAEMQGRALAAEPAAASVSAFGSHGSTLIALEGRHARTLVIGQGNWSEPAAWLPADADARPLALAPSGQGLFVVTADRVTRIESVAGALSATTLPTLPAAPADGPAVAAVFAKQLYVASGAGFWSLDLVAAGAAWQTLPAAPLPLVAGSVLIDQVEQLTLFTPAGVRAYLPRSGWKDHALAPAPFALAPGVAASRYAAAHVLFSHDGLVHAYHVPTDTWTEFSAPADLGADVRAAAPAGEHVAVLAADGRVVSLEAKPLPTGYNWMDHTVVAAYMLAMIGISVWFARRKQDANDFFRGGNRIPWWVSGMSLFATFASGISMMAMPGKGFAGDWTYFSQSLFALLVLPVSLFVLTPLVRCLKIPTANAYLERRFGLSARMIASTIAVFATTIARQGSVLVVPAIALSTVMGVDVVTCILVMGAITLAYTFFGGLEAVVWTDTVQGFVMVGSVVACIGLALWRIDMPASEMWSLVQNHDKLRTFDWDPSLLYPTSWIFLLTTVVGTLASVGSQDYIQRVQCTPDLKQAQLAVATQLFVAVPLNLLLFGLGTVLFLFYHQHPESLSPAMKTDGIFPFFVAQQLPPGLSGLVVAALLAATMSTISSCTCSVSDMITQDFYKRFRPDVSDRSVLVFGRSVTLVAGLAGVGTAVWMANATLGSMWDLATMVTSLISNGVVGLFTLGLLTKRAHQSGALVGVVSGMVAVWLLKEHSTVTLWLYTTVGTLVTVAVGYVASLVLPGRVPPIAGLTVYTLKEKTADA